MSFIARLCCAAVLVCASALPSFADEDGNDPATRAAIQKVITQQLDAFAHADAAKAEAFASQALRKKFPEPKKFLDMVKSNYGALINPKRTHFDETSASPHGPLQKMTIIAADGTVWTAIYSFEKADDGWHISGCGIEKLDGQQDI